jgi:hypothetical protein
VSALQQKQSIDQLIQTIDQQKQEYQTLYSSLAEADAIIEQYKLQETILLERIKKQTLQIKEMKLNSRLTRFYEMAEENLKLAEEVARLKKLINKRCDCMGLLYNSVMMQLELKKKFVLDKLKEKGITHSQTGTSIEKLDYESLKYELVLQAFKEIDAENGEEKWF